MRFNKAELVTLATNPTTKFEREGLLIITERQEGFFRRADVNHPRWCKLRGNLLFYLKDQDPRSAPIGLIVLENCRPLIKNDEREFDGFAFILEFEGSFPQRLSARTAKERLDWIKSIQLASYSYLCRQITYLNEQIAAKMGNRIQAGTALGATANNASLTNLAAAEAALPTASASSTMQHEVKTVNKLEEDLTEIPICESAISCTKLPLDEQGRPPNPRIVVAVLSPADDLLWRDFARTEIVLRTVNPQFLCTICFRRSDGFSADSVLRFTVYDVREKVSSTSVPLGGTAEVALGVIQDATRFRIPMRSLNGDCGFITISSWAPDAERLMPPPPRSTTQVFEQPTKEHRRSQSLPPKLGVKLFVPFQAKLQSVFANPRIHTYRLHSSMGGDISVHECMLESKLCFTLPQQLLSIWILREKELLQEISGMGELGGEWRRKQMELLDKHLKLLKDYAQAKQNLQQITKEAGPYFKRSSVKTDESLEFIPVNLHLQRMWTQNDTLNKRGLLDIVTVGAFTRHAGKTRTGGLIKLLQFPKESPSKFESGSAYKVLAANSAVQAVKQLRKEIVDIMSQLLYLAKSKNPKGMMPLCNEMVSKTKKLLNIWEPCLVEEAFAFIEQNRILDEPDNIIMPMSPFRKITQQLSALDLKSPELENFATPVVAPPDLWPHTKHHSGEGIRQLGRSHSLRLRPSTSASDLNAIHSLQTSVQRYNEQLQAQSIDASSEDAEATAASNQQFQSLPVTLNQEIDLSDTHFDQRCCSAPSPTDDASIELIDLDEVNAPGPSTSIPSQSHINLDGLEHLASIYTSAEYAEDDGFMPTNCSIALRHNVGFLDTQTMSSSPSANYYRPTEEPEPLDLTQLNIEASVMCLVSKIKFLCGRCGSPAIRLRHPKTALKRACFKNAPAPDVVVSQSVVCATDDLAGSSENEENAKQQHEKTMNDSAREFHLDLTQQTANQHQDQEQVASKDNEQQEHQHEFPKKGNKFTDGLDLSLTTDWASELRPSMRKLRYAMDGLLKTARLMHSVQRLQQDMKRNSINLEIMYRRDVCFSQAFTALVSGLMAKLWGGEINENYIRILSDLGPLAYFEGLLSLYGSETDMWGDMCIGIEDLQAINFTLVRCKLQRDSSEVPTPRVTGTRLSLTVLVPVPEHVFVLLPTKAMLTFKITPVFFNIGINEKATLAETLGFTREQHRSNWDNFVRLKQYFSRFRQLPLQKPHTPSKQEPHPPVPELVGKILATIEDQLRANMSKNVKILQLAEDVCRFMSGLRFTSCKSAKDRTGMAVTLEQSRVLLQEFQLPSQSLVTVLGAMRSEGTRMDNVFKNIEKRKYAFNLPQVLSLPTFYRPPVGAYGKAET